LNLKILSRSRKLKSLIKEYIYYLRYVNKKKNIDAKTTKKVYFDFSDFHRHKFYFYSLAKFFKIQGYSVFIKKSFYSFHRINKEASRVFEESFGIFVNKIPSGALVFNDTNTTVDYFSRGENESIYYVPMAMHPVYYHKNIWHELQQSHKINSIFFAGNIESRYYKWIENSPFDVIPRHDLIGFLVNKGFGVILKNPEDYVRIKEKGESKKIIIIDRKVFSIPSDKFRVEVSRFSFFLACPGILMPLSHNLIEAMSVGSIPIIQKAYADILIPPLIDMKNAIIFNSFDDLTASLNSVYDLDDEDRDRISKNVIKYYDKYLTPYSVIKKIEDIYMECKIGILGGSFSVDCLKRSIKKS
tara:strand:+ start:14292 stop:15362 length:1071 start_codon:yes stop_codon:yes gene_type:complete